MATTIHLDAFLPLVQPYVGACPKIVITNQIRQAAIIFCERTRLWRETITQSVVAAETAIDIPTYAALHTIRLVTWEGQLLTAAVHDDLFGEEDVGTPYFYSTPETDKIHIAPYTEGELVIRCTLKPRQGQSFGTMAGDTAMQDAYDRVPDFLHRNHGDVIADGAIAAISAMPNQEYSNPEIVAYHSAMFNQSLSNLSASEFKNQTRPRTRSKTIWF
jgi:hypothetical protein